MAGANLIVFRETAETVSGRALGERLLTAISTVAGGNVSSIVDALLVAGEVECALGDCGWASADKAEQVTNILAALFLQQRPAIANLRSLSAEIAGDMPESVRISHPEGFCYYALHPGDFADAVTKLQSRGPVAVIGIRSVGTTLSAVAMAALQARGVPASRITVRPGGHPYDRTMALDQRQRVWIGQHDISGTTFLVVDEGPGLSGSSFLSVAECLMKEGIAAERIDLMGTRDADPAQLCAKDASSRWKRFPWRRVSSRVSERFGGSICLSGGAWRDVFLSGGSEWPAYWPEMDGVKYWSRDRKSVFKFEGFGTQMWERSQAISHAGFGPRVQEAGDGMSRYEFIAGSPLSSSDCSAEVLDRIVDYCAFRAAEFKSDRSADAQLDEMVRFNFLHETGRECPIAAENFRTAFPVIVDNRMSPHEWIGSASALMKVDACRHGDDHFMPGPTDIAWDLAGAIVEWNLDRAAEQYFLSRFRARSGIIPERIGAFVLAYSLFRASYCKMALMGTGVESEKIRLQNAYELYRQKMDAAVPRVETESVI